MQRSYGSVNPTKDKINKIRHEAVTDFHNLKQKQIKLSLNTVLGIAFGILFIALIIGFIMLSLAKQKVANAEEKIPDAYDNRNHTTVSHSNIIVTNEILNNTITSESRTIDTLIPGYNATAIAGQPLDIDAIYLQLEYTDGTTETIPGNNLTLPDYIDQPLNAGLNIIQLEYHGTKCALMVTAESDDIITKAMNEFSNEYADADYAYASESLFCTINKYTDPDTYWMAHVIVAPGNLPKVVPGGEGIHDTSSILQNQKEHGWKFGINGSYCDGDKNICDGVYINDSQLINGEDASGNELCITSDGTLFTPAAGTSYTELIENGTIHTALSENPVIINDGQIIDIEPKKQETCKTVIGMVRPYEYYIVVASDGQYITDITYNDISQILQQAGCTYAKALSSAANVNMVYDGEIINQSADKDKELIDVIAFYDN